MIMEWNTIFFYAMISILVWANLCSAKSNDYNFVSCYCGVFRKGYHPSKSRPIIEENSKMQVELSNAGREDCARLCALLAEEGDENAAVVLCEAYKEDVDHLRVSIYFRIQNEPWTCIGTQAFDPVCCRNKKPIYCDRTGLFRV